MEEAKRQAENDAYRASAEIRVAEAAAKKAMELIEDHLKDDLSPPVWLIDLQKKHRAEATVATDRFMESQERAQKLSAKRA